LPRPAHRRGKMPLLQKDKVSSNRKISTLKSIIAVGLIAAEEVHDHAMIAEMALEVKAVPGYQDIASRHRRRSSASLCSSTFCTLASISSLSIGFTQYSLAPSRRDSRAESRVGYPVSMMARI
jgi:hypothetical protein